MAQCRINASLVETSRIVSEKIRSIRAFMRVIPVAYVIRARDFG